MSERILVLYRKQLGDLLILQPAIEFLSRRHGLPVDVFCRPGMDDLLRLMPGDIRRAPQWPGAYRAVYSFDPKPGATWYAALARSPEKHLLLTRRSFVHRWHRLVYGECAFFEDRDFFRGEIFYRLAGGSPAAFQAPRLEAPPADWAPGGVPGDYVLIHPTAAWRQKCWAPARWAEALAPWLQDRGWVVTSGGADWEVDLAGELADRLGPSVLNFAGRTSLRQYIGLLHKARAVLCVDGSASHIAAAFGVPSLTLFGPSNATQWHYPGPQRVRVCAGEHAPDQSSRLDALPLGPVRDALRTVLGEAAHGRG